MTSVSGIQPDAGFGRRFGERPRRGTLRLMLNPDRDAGFAGVIATKHVWPPPEGARLDLPTMGSTTFPQLDQNRPAKRTNPETAP